MKRYIFALILLLIVAGAWCGFKLFSPNTLPIRSVVINGNLHFIQKDKLAKTLQPLGSQGFFSVDLDKIQVAMQQLSWVADVEVRRVWPDKIVIDITACQPVANWNNNAFLNAYGEIFVPQTMIEFSQNLPRFFGQQDQTVKMLDNYQQMNNILSSLKLQIETLTYGNDHSWQIKLNNGINLQLGQQHVLERLMRFVKTYKKILLTHRNMIPKKVDLRYSHGLAVSYS